MGWEEDDDVDQEALIGSGERGPHKSVAQAIPTYIMSVFKLPFGLCDDLSSIIRDFWWGIEDGRRKTAWIAWEAMLLKKG